jgi:phage-related protein
VIGGVITGIGTLSSVLSLLVSPVGLVIAGILALVAGFIYLWNTNEHFKNAVIQEFGRA